MNTEKMLLIFLGFFSAFTAFAQIRSGDNVVISDEVKDDLYIAGGTVTINAPVAGDLIVVGGTIIVNDSIAEDILVAGGDIAINGNVGDDIRGAGGVITLSSHVAGDLIVAGGTIKITREAVVDGDLFSTGGEVRLDGVVSGDVRSASGDFVMNGTVGKDLELRGGEIVINGTIGGTSVLSARVIELGSGATFKDDVRYWNDNRSLDFNDALAGGHATFDTSLAMEKGRWHYLGFASFLMVLWYLATALLMIIIIQYLFRITFRNAANTIKNASLKSLGVGFLFLIAVPVAIVVATVTIIGLPVAIMLLIGYVTMLVMATVIVSLLVSNWINNTYYQASWGTGRIIIAAFVIFIFLKLASLTPFIGPLIMLLLVGMAFGGILLNVKWKKNKALSLT